MLYHVYLYHIDYDTLCKNYYKHPIDEAIKDCDYLTMENLQNYIEDNEIVFPEVISSIENIALSKLLTSIFKSEYQLYYSVTDSEYVMITGNNDGYIGKAICELLNYLGASLKSVL